MAKPISETPVLKGQDAQKFLEARLRTRDKEAVKKERERILNSYNTIKNSIPSGRSVSAK